MQKWFRHSPGLPTRRVVRSIREREDEEDRIYEYCRPDTWRYTGHREGVEIKSQYRMRHL